ncbi:MAG: nucleoside monophosphate kinase, partial [Betaproteobacteria bacterium]|nr:nucleoside monophosphate kinase [Betaproteobacteria bacterium]
DDIVIGMIEKRLQDQDAQSGFLLDGFPRTVAQADALAARIDIDEVIELRCASEVIVERMSGRRIHPASGRVYHLVHNPPRQEGLDDVTGEPLVVRDDDREEVVLERLRVYEKSTAPLSGYYAAAGSPQHHVVAAEGDIDEITERIARIIKS